jgi:hypothetical protein
MAGMAGMLVGLINHAQTLRSESRGQLICDMIFGSHDLALTTAVRHGQSWSQFGGTGLLICQDLKLGAARPINCTS